jgi:hypothetical protein
LAAAKLLERGCGDLGLTGHAGSRREDAVRANEIGALAHAWKR